ncbi:MAG: hypothetical protein JWO78_1938 [Micavibrio sp.]|nr:hypothetical protein [Micavibrio sp.]
MRRIYIPGKEQRPAVRDALKQLRETQAALGPELITRIKMLIKDVDPESVVRAWAPEAMTETQANDDHKEAVDKKKNLLIIMKFLQMKPDDKNVQSQVRTMLSETTTLQ